MNVFVFVNTELKIISMYLITAYIPDDVVLNDACGCGNCI